MFEYYTYVKVYNIVLIIIHRPTSFSCILGVWIKKRFLANRNGTYCYLHASERREIPFIRLHFTDHMNVKWKTCWKSKSRRKKTYDVDVVVITIIAIKREKNSVALVFFCRAGLSGMYLCITCGLHIAHCLSHEIKTVQFLKESLWRPHPSNIL